MSQQSEARDIGAGVRAVLQEDLCCELAGLLHLVQCRRDPALSGLVAHVCGEQCSGSKGLAHNESVASLKTGLAQQLVSIREGVHAQAETQLAGLARVTSNQGRVVGIEYLGTAGHHLQHLVFHDVCRRMRQADYGQCAVGSGSHGMNVAKAMHRGNARKKIRIVHECSKMIDGLQQYALVVNSNNGGIFGAAVGTEYIVVRAGVQIGQHAAEHVAADFSRTAGAAQVLGLRWRRGPRVSRHEALVDPVLPAPCPVALNRPLAPGSDGLFVAGVQQCQRLGLRRIGQQGFFLGEASEIARQRHPLANRKDTRLGAWLSGDGGDVAGSEDEGMTKGLQAIVYSHEPFGVERQASGLQPGRGGGAGSDDRGIAHKAACLTLTTGNVVLHMQLAGFHSQHATIQTHVYVAFLQRVQGQRSGLGSKPPQ